MLVKNPNDRHPAELLTDKVRDIQIDNNNYLNANQNVPILHELNNNVNLMRQLNYFEHFYR